MCNEYHGLSWEELITCSLEMNGEIWEDVKYTPFNENTRLMSSDPRDEEEHYIPPVVVAWTEKYVYTAQFDWDNNYYLITPYPRNPPASL